MASIRKLHGKWQVQIRRKGFPATSRMFIKQQDAREWARHMEIRADRKDLDPIMRRGEILRVKWQDIDFTTRTLSIPITKNGHPRTIPLSSKAIDILNSLHKAGTRVFPASENAFKLAWQRLCKRAGIIDLHFHDLRHEAISRFIEHGLSVPEAALISGHRDYRMLARYTHLKPESLVKKLG